MTSHVETSGDVAIVRCRGRIVSGEAVCAFRRAVYSVDGARLIVLDLSDVPSIDAAGLTALLSLHHRIRSQGVHLKLVNPSFFVQEMLDRTRLTPVFDISSFHHVLAAVAGAGCPESTVPGKLAMKPAGSAACQCL